MPEVIEENIFQYEQLLSDYFLNNLKRESSELIEKKRFYNKDDQTGFVYDIVSPDGIHYRHTNLVLHGPGNMTIHTTEPFYHLCFSVRNKRTYHTTEAPFACLQNYEYNVLYIPYQQTEVAWAADYKTEVFELNLSQQLLESYIPNDHPYLSKIKDGDATEPLAISAANIPMTPQITSILLDILNCPLKEYYKRLFIKAKVFELLSIVFAHMSTNDNASEPRNVLKESEVQKMQKAREILHSNLQSPCSLIDLAHQVGTNENYLKKHFKQLYGNTVYGYIQDLRMQQAKTKLVQNEEMHHIAKSVGYKNVHHFSVAFKKYFGYSPHAVRNAVGGN